jgi:hypothetical protein
MKLMRLLTSMLASALLLMPSSALAGEGTPIQGAFAVTATATPNTGGVTYCGGTALSLAVEANGNGFSSLGALSLSLLKTINVPGAMHGCLALVSPNGDTLNATYDGTNRREWLQTGRRYAHLHGRNRSLSGSYRKREVHGRVSRPLPPQFISRRSVVSPSGIGVLHDRRTRFLAG